MDDGPTQHGPGSQGKMQVLSERYFSGLPLWHPDDEPHCSRDPQGGASSAATEEDDDDE